MDVVYLCRPGDNPELRLSLRSLQHHVAHDRVWIIGGWPDWVANVAVVGVHQTTDKHRNTTVAMRVACNHPDISDPFMVWNDDFYALEPTHVAHWHRGPAVEVIDLYQRRHPTSPYTKGMRATIELLEASGYPDPLSYELHMPLIVHKAEMLAALDLGQHLPVAHKRTIYGNLARLGGEQRTDCKVYEPGHPLPTPWASTEDRTFRHYQRAIRDALPRESPRYEGW